MALSFSRITLILLLASFTTALQVSPNSPCASVCLDNSNSDPSSPSSSNTYSSDISCNDADYNSTAVGKKFQACLSCLQTSTFSATPEVDQLWFIYNLRFTVDYCLFGFPNNPAPLNGPCITPSSCGSLVDALETGALNPNNGSTYDYCSAAGGAFNSDAVGRCSSCLVQQSGSRYIANFLIALQAGCTERTPVGLAIGLAGSLFSTTVVNITTPFNPATVISSTTPNGLSTGAKIGIAVGSVVLVLIVAGVIVICTKKRKRRNLSTAYDPRFGATEISAPNQGAYSNPNQITPPTKPIPPYEIPIPKIPTTLGPSTNVDHYPMDKYSSTSPSTTTTVATPSSLIQPSHASRRGSSSTKFSGHSSSPEPSPDFPRSFSGNNPPNLPRSHTPLPVHAAYIPTPNGPAVEVVSGFPGSPGSPGSLRAYAPQSSSHSFSQISPPGRSPEPPYPYSRSAYSTPATSPQAIPGRSVTPAFSMRSNTPAPGAGGGIASIPERMRSTRTNGPTVVNGVSVADGQKDERAENPTGRDRRRKQRRQEAERETEQEQWPGSY